MKACNQGNGDKNNSCACKSLTHEEICSSLVKPENYEEIGLPMSSVQV